MQAYTLFGVPLTIAFTLRMLGFQVLFERLWEWETCIPKETLFPHTSHFAISYTSINDDLSGKSHDSLRRLDSRLIIAQKKRRRKYLKIKFAIFAPDFASY